MAPSLLNDIVQSMADALPTHDPGDTTSDLSSSHEAVALFTHSYMTLRGFRLLGFSEDSLKEAECHELAPRMPANWNASFNSCTFVYSHRESTRRFLIKVDRMGAKAEIHGLVVDGVPTARAQITMRDFVSNTALPLRITMTADGVEDRSDLQQKLLNVFIAEGHAMQLALLLRDEIISKLLSALPKEAHETADDVAAREDAQNLARMPYRRPVIPDAEPQPARPYLDDGPFGPSPRPAAPAGDFPPPGFEDPYDLNRPPPQVVPDRTPFGNIGADDLNPPGLGPHDPLRPGLGVPGGVLPRPGRTRGMYPTFDDLPPHHPLGGMGGDLFPPVPPGARYDPVGPGGVPRFSGRGRGGGRGPFGGGGGFHGFGGGDII